MGKKKPDDIGLIKVFLAVCSHRSIDVAHELSSDSLITGVPKGFTLTKVTGLEASIAKSRSSWLTIFHKFTDCDVLAFIDDDVVFDAPDFWKICKMAHDKKCMVGGVYMKRELPPSAVVKVPGNKFRFDGTVQEVDGLGAGFIAISRDVVDSVVKDCVMTKCGKKYKGEEILVYYPTFAEIVVDVEDGVGNWLGEDYGFCRRVKDCGFKILADTSIFLSHIGVYAYSPNDINISWPGKNDRTEINVDS